MRVRVEACSVGGIAEVSESGFGVLHGVAEGEAAGGSPGTAIVEVKDVPAGAADGLREVEVALVAGKAVEEDDRGVRGGAGGDVDEGIELVAVAGDLEGLRGGRVRGVGCGVGEDGGGSLLGEQGRRQGQS